MKLTVQLTVQLDYAFLPARASTGILPYANIKHPLLGIAMCCSASACHWSVMLSYQMVQSSWSCLCVKPILCRTKLGLLRHMLSFQFIVFCRLPIFPTQLLVMSLLGAPRNSAVMLSNSALLAARPSSTGAKRLSNIAQSAVG